MAKGEWMSHSPFSGSIIYDVGEEKSRFSLEEKWDGNSLASFSFYNRKQVNFPVE